MRAPPDRSRAPRYARDVSGTDGKRTVQCGTERLVCTGPATPEPVRQIRTVTLPGALVDQLHTLLEGQAFAHLGISQPPNSVDNMSPNHPFIRTLAAIHVEPTIKVHSIIAVKGRSENGMIWQSIRPKAKDISE